MVDSKVDLNELYRKVDIEQGKLTKLKSDIADSIWKAYTYLIDVSTLNRNFNFKLKIDDFKIKSIQKKYGSSSWQSIDLQILFKRKLILKMHMGFLSDIALFYLANNKNGELIIQNFNIDHILELQNIHNILVDVVKKSLTTQIEDLKQTNDFNLALTELRI